MCYPRTYKIYVSSGRLLDTVLVSYTDFQLNHIGKLRVFTIPPKWTYGVSAQGDSIQYALKHGISKVKNSKESKSQCLNK